MNKFKKIKMYVKEFAESSKRKIYFNALVGVLCAGIKRSIHQQAVFRKLSMHLSL